MRIWLTLLISVMAPVQLLAEADNNKPTAIRTLSDEREVQTINDNFNRIVSFGVVYTSFGMVVPAGINDFTVTLPTPQKDMSYGVFASVSTGTLTVLSKATTGYRLILNGPALQRTVDHIVVR